MSDTNRLHIARANQNKAILDGDTTVWNTSTMTKGESLEEKEEKNCADENAVYCVLAGGLCFVAGVCWYVVKLFF